MADQLAIVARLMDDHQKVRTNLKLVGDSVSDLEGLISLERVKPDWMLAPSELLAEKHDKLLQTISSLRESMENHFSYEEEYLPPIFGDLIMHALMLEHADVKKAMDGLQATLKNTVLTGLTSEQLMTARWNIQQKLEDLRQLIQGHATKEDILIQMVKKALEDKVKRPGG
jgi:hemerythrin